MTIIETGTEIETETGTEIGIEIEIETDGEGTERDTHPTMAHHLVTMEIRPPQLTSQLECSVVR